MGMLLQLSNRKGYGDTNVKLAGDDDAWYPAIGSLNSLYVTLLYIALTPKG